MATQTLKMVIQFRRDTTANWELYKDLVPAAGEPCFDIDLGTLKIGDGVKSYGELEPIGGNGSVALSADGKSIVLEDGVFKLAGFDAAEVGAQPRKKSDDTIEWVVPSTETADGLQSAVAGLQSDIKALKKDVGTPTEGMTIIQMIEESKYDDSALLARVTANESAIATLNGDATVEGSVLKTVQDEINAFATKISDDGVVNSYKELIDYVTKHGTEAVDMAADILALQGLVGLTSVKDQIAAAGHMTKAEADETLLSKIEAVKTLRQVKYEISSKPVGTLVNYGDKEIRVMVPADTEFVHQNSGATAAKNQYYIGFKAYAPEGAVSFKEDLAEIISDDTMYYFEGNDFAGVDTYGRKYSICWLSVAYYDEATQIWTRYAEKSSKEKYIGYYYSVEWYDANGVKIDSDCIRISLSNEDCHNTAEPYYMGQVVKGVSVGGTLLDMVNRVVNIPVGAGLKASEEVLVAADGTMSIGAISFNKIVQEDDLTIVMDGGNAV